MASPSRRPCSAPICSLLPASSITGKGKGSPISGVPVAAAAAGGCEEAVADDSDGLPSQPAFRPTRSKKRQQDSGMTARYRRFIILTAFNMGEQRQRPPPHYTSNPPGRGLRSSHEQQYPTP